MGISTALIILLALLALSSFLAGRALGQLIDAILSAINIDAIARASGKVAGRVFKWILMPRRSLAFWIWRNWSGDTLPFYDSPALQKYQTHTEPTGWKRGIWNRAVAFLISQGELTHTPTLREKF